MRLDALLAPKSIAIVGASPKPSIGRSLIETLEKMGFPGEIYPVNPRYEDILGRRAYASIDALPSGVDLATFCVSSRHILGEYEKAAAKGIRGAVIYDGGFAELGGEGAKLQQRILDLSREADMSLCGPNCMGILNPLARSTSYITPLVDTESVKGNVALIAQSGSICIGLVADVRRFGFSHLISSGNEAVTTAAQYLEHLVEDADTKVIALFLESVREPDRFVAALDSAADKGKPVVVLKVGKSNRSRAAVTTHTGGLAGESRVFSAVLRAHRAIEVDDLDEMTEVLALCQGERLPKGRRIGAVVASGGQTELILDLSTEADLDLPPLKPAVRAEAERVIGPLLGDGNPLDAWGHGEYLVNIPHAFDCLAASGDYDVVVYCGEGMDGQPTDYVSKAQEYVQLIGEATDRHDVPFVYMSMRPGVFRTDQVRMLRAHGVPLIGGTRQGLGAIDRVARSLVGPGKARTVAGAAPKSLSAALAGRTRKTVHEYDAKQLLAAAGVPVTREELARDLAGAKAAAARIGYPVVLKVASDDIAHKSDVGLVAVGIADEAALSARWQEFQSRAAALPGKPPIDGWIVQEMIRDGVEVFAGVKRDPDFGLVLAFGLGGVMIEVLDDVALRMLPLREGDAEAMIAETHAKAVLAGVRGAPPADVAALAKCLYAVADYARRDRAHIAELDVNPIKVRAAGQGCVVVDALIAPHRA